MPVLPDPEITLEYLFDKYQTDYLKFDRVEPKRSRRPDLHAFLLLDSLFPGGQNLVAAAEHDRYYLAVDCHQLLALAQKKPEIVLELTRCGIQYDGESDSLCSFV